MVCRVVRTSYPPPVLSPSRSSGSTNQRPAPVPLQPSTRRRPLRIQYVTFFLTLNSDRFLHSDQLQFLDPRKPTLASAHRHTPQSELHPGHTKYTTHLHGLHVPGTTRHVIGCPQASTTPEPKKIDYMSSRCPTLHRNLGALNPHPNPTTPWASQCPEEHRPKNQSHSNITGLPEMRA